jgi:hypothetical protein
MGFGWPKTLPLLGRVISRWIPRDLSLDPVTQHGPDRSLAFLQGAPLIVDFRDAHPGIVGMYAQPACRISPSLAGTDTLRPRHSNWTISSPPPCCRRMWRRKLAGSGMSEAEAAQLWGGSCLLGCTISSQRATSPQPWSRAERRFTMECRGKAPEYRGECCTLAQQHAASGHFDEAVC